MYIDYLILKIKGQDVHETSRKKSTVTLSNREGSAKLALEQLLADCMLVLGSFEWPGAEILLYSFCCVGVL